MKSITKSSLQLVLIIGLLLMGVDAAQAKKKVFKGKVTTEDNRGIAGVVVSDGHGVAVTNDKGEYVLKGNDLAKFVFISVPSAYEIPANGGMPLFYQSVKGKKKATVNFKLAPNAKKDDKIVLTVMADPQMQKKVDMNRFHAEAVPDFANLQTHYPRETTFLGFTAGDNTWDAPDLYPSYVKGLEKISYPFFQVIGNHDHDQHVVDNDYESSHNFEKFFGPAYYSFNRGDCHFVALDNIVYGKRTKYQTVLTQAQLDWLKEDLRYVPKDKLIVLSMHCPMVRRGNKPGVKNTEALLKVLEGYEVVALAGHTHRMNKAQVTDKIVEYTMSPTMGNSWAGDVNTDGTPNGYGVFEFEGNKLVNQYFKSTKHAPNYQLALYPLKTVKDKEEAVVAFVWNYSSGWKVEVYENGVNKGIMQQFTGYDPVAYDFYLGPDKPKRKPKLEPARTPFLFYYVPEQKTASIEVVVSDNFGNRYKASLSQAR